MDGNGFTGWLGNAGRWFRCGGWCLDLDPSAAVEPIVPTGQIEVNLLGCIAEGEQVASGPGVVVGKLRLPAPSLPPCLVQAPLGEQFNACEY